MNVNLFTGKIFTNIRDVGIDQKDKNSNPHGVYILREMQVIEQKSGLHSMLEVGKGYGNK